MLYAAAGVIAAFIVVSFVRSLFSVVTEINIHDRGTGEDTT